VLKTLPYQNACLGINESEIMRRWNQIRRAVENIRIIKIKKEWSIKSKRMGENRLKKIWILKWKTNIENRNVMSWLICKIWNSNSERKEKHKIGNPNRKEKLKNRYSNWEICVKTKAKCKASRLSRKMKDSASGIKSIEENRGDSRLNWITNKKPKIAIF